MTTKDLQEVALVMRTSIERLYALLENLLHWALVQQGLMSFSPQPLNLHELVNTSTEYLRSVAELKQIAIYNNIPEKLEAPSRTRMMAGSFSPSFLICTITPAALLSTVAIPQILIDRQNLVRFA